MSKDETMLLIQLVESDQVIVSKATNATNNKLKEEAWSNLATKFNSASTTGPRTPAQLRLKWENLKKAARKRAGNIRVSRNKVITNI